LKNFVLYEDEAYVEYDSVNEAKEAIDKFDRYNYKGRKILVEWAHIEEPRGSRGGDRDSFRERRFRDSKCYNCGEYGHI